MFFLCNELLKGELGMKTNIAKKINNEILVFIGLSVVNIIFAAIALAMGIVFIINHLPSVLELSEIFVINLGYIILGFGLFVIGIWWIIHSVTIMDFITTIQWKIIRLENEYSEDKITSLIIDMLSYFRDHNDQIKKMIIICRLGGIFFIANGFISLIDILFRYDLQFLFSHNIMKAISIVTVFIWGIISLCIPFIIAKFASIWEYRIEQSKEAENLITRMMEQE